MSIKGIEELTIDQLNYELDRGAKFVMYQYCISAIVITFRRSSDVYFIRSDESAIPKGLLYSLISFVVGWWGFPWGPIFTIGSFIRNFTGGQDVTAEIIHHMNQANQSAQNS